MALRGLLALMAGGLGGYNEGNRYADQQARTARMDQITLDRAAREASEFNQAQADRAELRAAGAPVVAAPDMVTDANGVTQQRMVKPADVDNADVGTPGAAPNLPALTVGGEGGLRPDQAATKIATMGSPDAVRQRQLAVLNKQSPERAALLAAHDLSAKNTQMDIANKEYDSALNSAASKGLEGLVDFTNKSGASPFQAKVVTSADGKVAEIHQIQPDGTLKPTGLSFENNAKGAMEAATMLAKSVPATAKLKHYADERRLDQADKREERTMRYQEGMLGVARQNANSMENSRIDANAVREQALADRREAAGEKAASKTAVERMPEADKLTYQAALKRAGKLEDLIDTAKKDGTWDIKNPNHKELDTERKTLIVKVRDLESRFSQKTAPAAGPITDLNRSRDGVDTRVTPATQTARDVEAGKTMVREFGGDLNRATQEAEKIEAEARKTTGDGKPILMRQAAMLRAGIEAARVGGTQQPVTAAPVKPDGPRPAAAVPVPARPAPPLMGAAPVVQEIPPPPPQVRQVGLTTQPNPAYAEWLAQYGEAWKAQQQAALAANDGAALAAKNSFNPYQTTRVR